MAFTLIQRHQLSDQIITDSQVDDNADIQQSKIHQLPQDLASKVNKSGDTMTGSLILNADPSQALGAATKQYVDNRPSKSTLISSIPFQWVDSHTVKIPAGFTCTDTTGVEILSYLADKSAIITQNGAGGLDTGSSTTNTWYYLWAIKDTTNNTVDALLSLSSTNPLLPGTYDKSRLMPIALRTDSSGNIMQVYIETLTVTHAVVRYTNVTLNRVGLTVSGLTYPTTVLMTTANQSTPADINCSTLIPKESTTGIFNFSCEDGNHGDLIGLFRTKGNTTDELLIEANSQATNDTNRDSLITTFKTDSSQALQYRITGQSGTSYVSASVLGFYMPIT